MKRYLAFFSVIVGLLLSLPVPVTAQDQAGPEQVGLRPDAPPYAVHGPFWVGTHEFVFDASGEHPMPVTAWYPALNLDGSNEAVTYFIMPGNADMTVTGHALLDSQPDATHAPYPLIVLSHGDQGSRLISPYYAEHLASYGFIVIAPDHYGDLMTADLQSFAFRLYHRPLDIARVIDEASTLTATAGLLKGMVDIDHVAVTGMSFGGLATLLAGGASVNMSNMEAYCKAYPIHDARCDESLVQTPDLATMAGLSAVPEGNWPSWGDPRVDAIVPIVPGPQVIGEGAKTVSIPTMLILASADTMVVPAYGGYPVWENLGSANKTLVEFKNADHFFSVFKCADGPWLGQTAFPVCSDPVWDSDRIHDLLDHFATAFLLDTLKGDKDAHAALSPDAAKFNGVRFETTMK